MEMTMHESSDTNAMTEVALALAMAFFSLMVLGMVSMSVPLTNNPEPLQTKKQSAATVSLLEQQEREGHHQEFDQDNRLIFYFEGQFFDRQLARIHPGDVASGGSLVLAIPESISVSEAINVKSQFLSSNPLITTINTEWLKRLESL